MLVGAYAGMDLVEDFCVDGRYVYIAGESLHIVDQVDLGHMVVVTNFPAGSGTVGLRRAWQYLYWYRTDGSLDILDVSDPPHAALVRHINSFTGANLEISGHYGYGVADIYASRESAVTVYDFSDPTAPMLVYGIESGFSYGGASLANAIAVCDSNVLIGRWNSLFIYSITNPVQPTLLFSNQVCGPTEVIQHVRVSGTSLFLAADSGNVRIFDLSDLSHPAHRGSFYIGWGAAANQWIADRILLVSNRVYASTAFVPLFIFETNSSPPAFIVRQPASVNTEYGNGFSLAVSAVSDGPVSFQWRQGVESLPGATNATLTITNAGRSDGGEYSVLVTSVGGGLLSDLAAVGVNIPIRAFAPIVSNLVVELPFAPMDGYLMGVGEAMQYVLQSSSDLRSWGTYYRLAPELRDSTWRFRLPASSLPPAEPALEPRLFYRIRQGVWISQ